MSREPANIVTVPVKFTGLVDGLCFTNLPEFIKTLQENLVAEVPTNITNVHIGVTQPSSTERSDLWVQVNTAGKYVCQRMFDGSQWQQIPPTTTTVYWKYGDSTVMEPGFILVDANNPHFTTAAVTAIQAQFYPSGGSGPWVYFATTFEGF
jgi:hypothetical protein